VRFELILSSSTPSNSAKKDYTESESSAENIFSDELDELLNQYLNLELMDREKIRDKIFYRCLPYVKKIARGLARRTSDPIDDLIQIGGIGLLKAMEKFNPLVGTRFKTYATYFITGEIRHYLRDKSAMIKSPREIYELYYRINQLTQELTQKLGHSPTDEELAEKLQCLPSKVSSIQEVEKRSSPLSLDQFLVTDDHTNDSVYIERLIDYNQIELSESSENRLLVEKALGSLKQELYDVVHMTYYDDMSQTDIARKLGISQMQVSRRLRKALELLFKTMQESDSPPSRRR
jgi:RNA polymerase sigma-B factor